MEIPIDLIILPSKDSAAYQEFSVPIRLMENVSHSVKQVIRATKYLHERIRPMLAGSHLKSVVLEFIVINEWLKLEIALRGQKRALFYQVLLMLSELGSGTVTISLDPLIAFVKEKVPSEASLFDPNLIFERNLESVKEFAKNIKGVPVPPVDSPRAPFDRSIFGYRR